jgi:hypothetical protein
MAPPSRSPQSARHRAASPGPEAGEIFGNLWKFLEVFGNLLKSFEVF